MNCNLDQLLGHGREHDEELCQLNYKIPGRYVSSAKTYKLTDQYQLVCIKDAQKVAHVHLYNL